MTYYLYQQPEDVNQIVQNSDFCYSLDNLDELQEWHIETNPDTNAFILQCDEYPQEGELYLLNAVWTYNPDCQWYQDEGIILNFYKQC